ncbi:MAG TPA: PorP/SprF family type IX secretion system membrane protein [Flavisolibacter sp.]
MRNLKPDRIFLAACCSLFSVLAFAQDIHFSQFHETPLYRNPAMAGIMKGDIRIQTVFRSQWNSFANAYKSGSFNAEYKLPVAGDDYLTLGMQVLYDRAGTIDMRQTHVLPVVNYHKSLSADRNMYLSAGFMGGLVQRRFDPSKMTTNSQYDGMGTGEVFAATSHSYWDGSAGLTFNSGLGRNPENNMVVGVAYHHFNRPKQSFYNDPRIAVDAKWVFSADLRFAVTEYTTMTLHSDHMRQGPHSSTMAGVFYGVKFGPLTDEPDYIISGGAFMRWNDAVIPTLKLDYRPFAVSLSYDVNISELKTTSYGRGGYELSLVYSGFLDRENTSRNAVRCPVF